VDAAAGAVTEAELSAFVKKHQLPLVIPFNEENAETIFGAGIDEQVTTNNIFCAFRSRVRFDLVSGYSIQGKWQ